jgi:hypothetical protein
VQDKINAVLRGAVGYETGLDALTVALPAEVDAALLTALHERCSALWRGGWQPAELHRMVTRRGSAIQARVIIDAVATYLEGFPPSRVDDRWLAQAQALGAQVWWSEPAAYLGELAMACRLDRVAILDEVLTLLTILAELPPIEVLLPPPGTATRVTAPSAGDAASAGRPIDTRLLDRVRALLAKAESTTFPAEAEAYTAKAQELIARHSIDEALLVARNGERVVVPFARRIGVDHPYDSEKVSLLVAVARANRCHAVWSPELGFVTLFGFDADLDAVDLLYTSLLLQAHRAMSQAEPGGGKAGRARLRAFRRSFLIAFAVRIGERLAAAANAAVAEAISASDGSRDIEPADGSAPIDASDLLPVLASRDERVPAHGPFARQSGRQPGGLAVGPVCRRSSSPAHQRRRTRPLAAATTPRSWVGSAELRDQRCHADPTQVPPRAHQQAPGTPSRLEFGREAVERPDVDPPIQQM